MSVSQHAIEHMTITGSATLTKGAGVTAAASGVAQHVASNPDIISLADLGIVVGISGVLVGAITNIIFARRKDKRERAADEREKAVAAAKIAHYERHE